MPAPTCWPCRLVSRVPARFIPRLLKPSRTPSQGNIKRDPDGYKDEFMLQVRMSPASWTMDNAVPVWPRHSSIWLTASSETCPHHGTMHAAHCAT